MGSSGTPCTSTPTNVSEHSSCQTSVRSPALTASKLKTIGMAASLRKSSSRPGGRQGLIGPGGALSSWSGCTHVRDALGAPSHRGWRSSPTVSRPGRAHTGKGTIMSTPTLPNVALVHGGFVDGSGWQGVHDHLVADGYRVAVVQNPTMSLEGGVAATNQVLDELDGPVVLVGHSYGGVVVTETGTDERVAAVVYIAAFAPDKDESVNTLIADPPPGAPVPPILPPRDGYLFLDRDKFHDSFAGDLDADEAAFMADSQIPWGVEALGGAVSEPGWRLRPSWYLVASDHPPNPPPRGRVMGE